MRVLFATPECEPLTKTGGLGDVSAALPRALRELDLDVRVLLPGYAEVLRKLGPCQEVARLDQGRLLQSEKFLVIDCPTLYQRDGGPYQDAAGADWPDNGLRFGLLSKVAALLGSARSPLAWRPDVVHCNDWPAALAPVFLREERERAATLLTVHNLAFQGNFASGLTAELGLPLLEGLEFYGRMSFLKGGLAYADAINTVSPTYAREMQTPEYGCGLDGLLRSRRELLSGIANGIDTASWNPAADARIAARYDASGLDKKTRNKDALQKRLKLKVGAETPLVGLVGRLTHQKGIDLVIAAIDELAAMAQVALLGKGERGYESALAAAAARHPGRIAVTIGFNDDLAHAIEAGADLFLMPSRYEPCGLNQMYSQRYGTLPVARATGGLVDTITDGESGFLFEGTDLSAALRRALAVFKDRRRWRAMQRAAMARDFSWGEPARRYAALYRRIARLQPA